ncbi:hypothetical protein [Pseudonocardia broussonetiae]|uniref:Uncharacterized protein n=1 Tax=Pseudonocardia broussonetiae TaxID=2736640 RepID=A0A6M6JHY2_9PSEU|nr:hypothetical protein [Pseudonocardia broussonetiae]QJY46660.1 hypothetical protein HOP40_13225 [Pseudonocardia broussonetiae]
MSEYIVTGPCAVVHVGDKIQYLYQGAPLPDGLDADEVKRLEGRGLVGKRDQGDLVVGSAAADKPRRPAASKD